jgi:hypothetical protein
MAVTRTPETVYRLIEHYVRQAERDLGRPVFPWEVQARMPIFRAEGSLRRDMLHLYRAGRLVRVGGNGARQGYRLPSRMERLGWAVNGCVWPWGCERVQRVAFSA